MKKNKPNKTLFSIQTLPHSVFPLRTTWPGPPEIKKKKIQTHFKLPESWPSQNNKLIVHGHTSSLTRPNKKNTRRGPFNITGPSRISPKKKPLQLSFWPNTNFQIQKKKKKKKKSIRHSQASLNFISLTPKVWSVQ